MLRRAVQIATALMGMSISMDVFSALVVGQSAPKLVINAVIDERNLFYENRTTNK